MLMSVVCIRKRTSSCKWGYLRSEPIWETYVSVIMGVWATINGLYKYRYIKGNYLKIYIIYCVCSFLGEHWVVQQNELIVKLGYIQKFKIQTHDLTMFIWCQTCKGVDTWKCVEMCNLLYGSWCQIFCSHITSIKINEFKTD